MKVIKLGRKELCIINKNELESFRFSIDENARIINHYINMMEVSDDPTSKAVYANMLSGAATETARIINRFVKES